MKYSALMIGKSTKGTVEDVQEASIKVLDIFIPKTMINEPDTNS